MPLSRRTTVKILQRPGSSSANNEQLTIQKGEELSTKTLRRPKTVSSPRPNFNGPARYAWGEAYPSDDIIAPIRHKTANVQDTEGKLSSKSTVLEPEVSHQKSAVKSKRWWSQTRRSTSHTSPGSYDSNLRTETAKPALQTWSTPRHNSGTINDVQEQTSQTRWKSLTGHSWSPLRKSRDHGGARPKSTDFSLKDNNVTKGPKREQQAAKQHSKSSPHNRVTDSPEYDRYQRTPLPSSRSPTRSSTVSRSRSPTSSSVSRFSDNSSITSKQRRILRTSSGLSVRSNITFRSQSPTSSSVTRYSDSSSTTTNKQLNMQLRSRGRGKAYSDRDTNDTQSFTSKGSSSFSDAFVPYYSTERTNKVQISTNRTSNERSASLINSVASSSISSLSSLITSTAQENCAIDSDDPEKDRHVTKIEVNLANLGTICEEYHSDSTTKVECNEGEENLHNGFAEDYLGTDTESDYEIEAPRSLMRTDEGLTCSPESPAAFLFKDRSFQPARPRLSFLSLVLKVKSEEKKDHNPNKQMISNSSDALPPSDTESNATILKHSKQKVKTVKKPSRLQNISPLHATLTPGLNDNNSQTRKTVTFVGKKKVTSKKSVGDERDRRFSLQRRLSAGTLLSRIHAQYDEIQDGYSASLHKDNPIPVFNYLRHVKEFPDIYERLITSKPSTDAITKPLLSYGNVYQSSQIQQTKRSENNVVQAAYNLGCVQPLPNAQQNGRPRIQSKPVKQETVNMIEILKKPPHLRPEIPALSSSLSSEKLNDKKERRKKQTEELLFAKRKSAAERLKDLQYLQLEAERYIGNLSTADAIRAREMSLMALGEEGNSIRRWWLAQKFCKYLRKNRMEDRGPLMTI